MEEELIRFMEKKEQGGKVSKKKEIRTYQKIKVKKKKK